MGSAGVVTRGGDDREEDGGKTNGLMNLVVDDNPVAPKFFPG